MKIVLANGCFDLFHWGHLAHLLAARKLGDELVVSVTIDEFVGKGEGRPVFKDWQRIEMIRALRVVDRALLVTDALDALHTVRPSVFVKGAEYRGKIEPQHQRYCDKHGIEIVFTDTPKWSSTELLRYYESQSGRG